MTAFVNTLGSQGKMPKEGNMSSFTIRIFGSPECERCQALVKAFQYHDIAYEYVDADAAENEALCDTYNVDELPHVQAMYSESGKVFHTHIGYISPIAFIEKAREHTKQLEEFFRMNASVANKAVGHQEVMRSVHEQQSKRPCGGCSKKNQPKP